MTDVLAWAPSSDFAVESPLRISTPARRDVFELPRLYRRSEFPRADTDFPTSNAYPNAMTVSALPDVVILPRHVILTGDYRHVLSSSFKKTRGSWHQGVEIVAENQYRLRESFAGVDETFVPGVSFYLDCEFPDIYGHNLLEVWPQTWPLTLLDRDDLQFVTSIDLKPYVTEVLGRLGVPRNRIVPISGPTRCELLYVAAPAVRARRYVHPICTSVFDRIPAWRDEPREADGPKRIFLSRAGISSERSLTNEAELEQIAVARGLTVVRPQELSITEQARVFSGATHIVGSGGSGMHNAVFGRNRPKVLIMGSSSWFVVVDIFLAQHRYDLSYVFGDAVDPAMHGTRGHVAWTLDPTDFRAALDDFLAD